MRVLLVDDERAALERLTMMHLWDEEPFTLVGAAKNGIEALKILDENIVDILITDIEMPRMNGLELIRQVRERGDTVHIIILSCHESFDYARKAMVLGVDDYLIKDFLEEDALRETLQRVSIVWKENLKLQELGEKRVRTSVREDSLSYVVKSLIDTRDDHFQQQLTVSVPPDSICFMCIVHVDSFREQKLSHEESISYIRDLFDIGIQKQRLKLSHISVIGLGEGDYLLWSIVEEESPSKSISYDLQQLITYSVNQRGVSLTISWDRLYSLQEDIIAAYDRLKAIARYRPYLGNARVIIPVHIQAISYIDSASLEYKIKELHRCGIRGDVSAVIPLIRKLYRQYLPGMIQFNYLQYLNSHVLTVLLQIIDTEGFNLQELFGKQYLPIQELNELDTALAISEWFERKFRRIQTIMDENQLPKVHNKRVQRILELIQSSYQDPLLTLGSIAKEIGVHKGYLSRVFKEETGFCCYEYLQQFRIRKAKRLLREESLKIYEIAEATGFHTYDQFCIVFKKSEGMSPTVYKESYRKGS